MKVGSASRTVTMFLDENFRRDETFLSIFFAVFVFLMDKHHDVGVLFDGTGIAQVGKARAAAALFDGARELRKGEYGNIEFLRHLFERARNFSDLLDEVVVFDVRRHHKLEIIHNDEAEFAFALKSAATARILTILFELWSSI